MLGFNLFILAKNWEELYDSMALAIIIIVIIIMILIVVIIIVTIMIIGIIIMTMQGIKDRDSSSERDYNHVFLSN